MFPRFVWNLALILPLLLYPSAAGNTTFIYPGPAGSPPIPGVGVNDVLILQWSTTEEFVTPVVSCHAEGAGGSVDGTDADGNAPGLNAQSFPFALGMSPFTSPATCTFMLFLGEDISIGAISEGSPPSSDSIAESAEIELLSSDTPTSTLSATTTITPTTFSTSTSPVKATSVTIGTTRIATPVDAPASTSSPSTAQPAVSTSVAVINQSVPLGLGLGLGIPFFLTILAISIYLLLRWNRRRRQRIDQTSDSDLSASEGNKKPELDAEETKTMLQREPAELEHLSGGLHEVDGSATYPGELYSDQDLRNVAAELPGRGVSLKKND